jgi:hypothetical protein
MMDIRGYFERSQGRGVLATADDEGRVDLAVYAKPHVIEDGTVAFIMADRLTHRNLLSNPHAAYMFIEEGGGYKGLRLFLAKLREEENTELLYSLRRRKHAAEKGEEEKSRFLVFFEVQKVLPLVGSVSP